MSGTAVALAAPLLALLAFTCSTAANCFWYNECGLSPETNKPLNCAYNGTAKPVDDFYAAGVFAELCPHMAEQVGDGELKLCCSPDQILSMQDSFFLVKALLGRCPSCLYNFRKVFCEMTCSPDQGRFMEVTKTFAQNASVLNPSGAPLVGGVQYRVGAAFVQGVYDSCKDVVNPSTSGSVFGLLCGPWGDLCTPQRLLNFLGDTSNGNTPFSIDFLLFEQGDATAYDPPVVACHESPPVHGAPSLGAAEGACSCTDCEAACVPPDLDKYDDERSDFEVTYGASVGAVFVLGLVAMAAAFIWRRKSKVHPINEGSSSKVGQWWNRNLLPIGPMQEKVFHRLGHFCAHHPWVTLVLSALLASACASGIHRTRVTTDPVELWASETSRSRIEMQTYIDTFGRFYRIEQIIITPRPSADLEPIPYVDLLQEEKTFSPIFQRKFLLALLKFQNDLASVVSEKNNVTFKDVCHQPLAPEKDDCNVQTVWAYWQDDPAELDKSGINEKSGHNDTYLDHLILCARNPLLQQAPTSMAQGCMSAGGIPVQPFFALGGIDSKKEFHNASAFIVTVLLDSSPEKESAANEWEEALTDFVNRWADTQMPEFMDVAFNTERAIQDEIERSSFGDIHIVILSYSVMILYIIFSLGRVTSCSTMPVEVKITLALFGTFLVLVSIASSVGIYGYFDVETTLVVFQILPFLVLAVGVDNIFILLSTLERVHFSQSGGFSSAEDSVAEVVGMVGPSMLMSTCAQATAFFLGSMSDMPAVRAFSLYAALSLVFNFVFQITALVAVMCLDLQRMLNGRVDVLCCVRGKAPAMVENLPLWIGLGVSKVAPSNEGEEHEDGKKVSQQQHFEGPLQKFFTYYYTPFLFHPWTKRIVMVLFFAWACISALLIPHLHVGLETESALPDDSPVRKYLITVKEHLSVGPPVYFVVNTTGDFNYSDPDIQNRLCGGQGCNADSLNAQIKLWSKEPDVTYIAAPSQSWIDDYFDWSRHCCKMTGEQEFCSKELQEATSSDEYDEYGEYGEYGEYEEGGGNENEVESTSKCEACLTAEDGNRPRGRKFRQALPWFIQENPSLKCPKAGKAAYSGAIKLVRAANSSQEWDVSASAFFTFHSQLRTSADFAESMRWARRLSANLTDMLNAGFDRPQVAVFPYSLFYVFYEQYLTIWEDAGAALGISLAAVFAVVILFTGVNIFAAAVTFAIILLTLVNIAGSMYWLGISLNAISLVNLVMSVGISVEFCSHLVAAFTVVNDDDASNKQSGAAGGEGSPAIDSREARARANLNDWGPVLLAGVHLTNLLGVSVLVLANSPVFNVYYFRMYMSVVLTGALHGLVLLPVVLSIFGP